MVFTDIVVNPYQSIIEESFHYSLLEKVVVVKYESSIYKNVNEIRIQLFSAMKNKTMEIFHPKAAMLQLSRKQGYEASIWTTSDIVEQNRTNPALLG